MDSERSLTRWYAILVAVLLVLVLMVGVLAAYRVWRKYDPYVMDRADNAAATRLLQTCTREPRQPLTREEFALAIKLLSSGESIAQLSAISVVAVAAERDPACREAVLAALATCTNPEEPRVGTAAAAALGRMKSPPPAAELPNKEP